MARLKRIDVTSSAIHIGAAMAVIGLVAGLVYAVGGLFTDLATAGFKTGTALAFGALIGMPVVFGLAGAFWGGIGAAVYNLVATRFGGMEMDWD